MREIIKKVTRFCDKENLDANVVSRELLSRMLQLPDVRGKARIEFDYLSSVFIIALLKNSATGWKVTLIKKEDYWIC